MKTKVLQIVLFLFIGIIVQAQDIKGTVVDSDTQDPLVGVNVFVKGSKLGTITDIDGNFQLRVDSKDVTLELSYIGYESMEYAIGSTTNLGVINLNPSAVGLEEVVITGVMDIVKDRRTPVAVSTIGLAQMQAKGGNVEFPELMKSSPSIYVANQSGGFGDSEVFTRGFDQTNTAFLLNGQPINGMEDGKMYWSNWSGMSDVANAVQIQRGLGSSKLAISSVGGTINIIMRPTAKQKGGTLQYMYGNNNYHKATVSYNTGMMNGKFGMSFLLTHWQGDGWAEGTKGQGQNYFVSAGYKINPKNELNFLITGAPQWHDQNFTKALSTYFEEDGSLNAKFNNNYGYHNGEYLTSRRNYYHKPVANLNWDYTISSKNTLSTVLYASWGRGGGTGGIGSSSNRKFTSRGYWDFDQIFALNEAAAGSKEYVLRSSVNNHSWYGIVSRLESKVSEHVTTSIGIDGRTYHGSHFREVANLWGAPAYTQKASTRYPTDREVSNVYEPNPWKAISNYAPGEDQIDYSYDETIKYLGVFGQVEYAMKEFSVFLQGALSNQAHQRFELFTETEANKDSEKVNNIGYNLKAGASYNLGKHSTVFFNTGYYSRQPFHDNIYLNFTNTVNPVTENENILGFEAGYKYENRKFSANINLYRTGWNNKTTTNTINIGDTINNIAFANGGFQNLSDLNQLHQGVEVDLRYKVMSNLTTKLYGSIGNWVYNGNAVSDLYDDNLKLVNSVESLIVDGLHVGGAAQTSLGLGVDYKVSGVSIYGDYNYYDNLYSNIGAANAELKLPAFGLLDLGLGYTFLFNNGQALTLRANGYNILGTEYLSKSTTAIAPSATDAENWNGVNKKNQVAFGTTQTWNVSAKFSF
ncbi:MAG: TonB-dependent receptor [Lewinellaceae bacterium]|nr:TonB-dependent receptor [Lewinellaceae bacterium]